MKILFHFKSSKLFFLLFLLFSSLHLYGQSSEILLQNGRRCYEYDKLDSANYYYGEAYKQESFDSKLKAISGLVNVALLQSDLALADSLIILGDDFNHSELDRKSVYPFEIIKGEYYKKNSQFVEALAQHKKIVKKSANWEEGILIYADALFYTALTLERMTQYDSCLIYIDDAYNIYKQNLDTTSVKFAEIYNGLGVCYYRANNYIKSKEFYLKSKEVCENRLGPVSSDLAVCLSNLSSISRAEENYQEAISFSEKALQIFKLLDDKKGISGAYYALGVYYYFLGDYGRTKDYMEACIAIREKLYKPDHYTLINPYEVLGIAFEESGNYEKTLYYLKKVRPIIIKNFGPNNLQEGFNNENTAICFKQIGELDSALLYIKKSNVILSQNLEDNAYQLATHCFTFSDILLQAGDIEGARKFILNSNRIYENLGMQGSSEYAQNLVHLALIAAAEKDWGKGDFYFNQGLNIIKTSEEDFSIKMLPNNLWVLNEYIGYLYQKYEVEQSENVLKEFQEYSKRYLKISESFRKQFNDPYTKSILIKDNTQLYNNSIGIYYQLYKETQNKEYLFSAYNFSEYGRGSMLRDMQDEKIKSYAGVPDSVIQQEWELKKKVSELNQQLIEMPDSTKIKKDLFESKEALNRHIENLSEEFPKYHQLKFNTAIASLEEIQSNLENGQNLIEYMQDDTAYYGLIANKETYDLKYLGNQKKINKTIKNWKNALINQDEETTRFESFRLYKQLWQPFEDLLNGERVIVTPTGPIFYINLETLSKTPDKMSFLIYDYNISYALSFNTFFAKTATTNNGNIISIAPGFEEEIKQAYQNVTDTLEILDEDYLQTVRQPWTVKLATSLKEKFNNNTYVGLEATESNIKANIHKGSLLYFGTHAITNSAYPLRSKLVLAKETDNKQEDGYLHAYELFGLQLNAELAVLNACESGLGSLQKGEGMISLAYSIQYAGCPSTIMSLWKVDEKINTQITGDFFDNLSKGKVKSEALREAKLSYLNSANGVLKSPFYWGGMVLMGKDGTLEIEGNTNFKNLVILLCLLSVILIFVFFRIRKKNK